MVASLVYVCVCVFKKQCVKCVFVTYHLGRLLLARYFQHGNKKFSVRKCLLGMKHGMKQTLLKLCALVIIHLNQNSTLQNYLL